MHLLGPSNRPDVTLRATRRNGEAGDICAAIFRLLSGRGMISKKILYCGTTSSSKTLFEWASSLDFGKMWTSSILCGRKGFKSNNLPMIWPVNQCRYCLSIPMLREPKRTKIGRVLIGAFALDGLVSLQGKVAK